jgi:alkylhydroperoxidase family enzyme
MSRLEDVGRQMADAVKEERAHKSDQILMQLAAGLDLVEAKLEELKAAQTHGSDLGNEQHILAAEQSLENLRSDVGDIVP